MRIFDNNETVYKINDVVDRVARLRHLLVLLKVTKGSVEWQPLVPAARGCLPVNRFKMDAEPVTDEQTVDLLSS